MTTFVYCGPLSGSIYVGRRRRVVKEHDDGTATFEVVGSKDVVTEDAIRAVIEHVRGCCTSDCICFPLRQSGGLE
jgi:hypothetical protein